MPFTISFGKLDAQITKKFRICPQEIAVLYVFDTYEDPNYPIPKKPKDCVPEDPNVLAYIRKNTLLHTNRLRNPSKNDADYYDIKKKAGIMAEKYPQLKQKAANIGTGVEIKADINPIFDDPAPVIEEATDLLAGADLRAVTPAGVFAAQHFVSQYASNLALDVLKVRSALTNKLMELVTCGNPKYELQAIALLGKHSDIGLFTDRSEITHKHSSVIELENAITSKIKEIARKKALDARLGGVTIDAAVKPIKSPILRKAMDNLEGDDGD